MSYFEEGVAEADAPELEATAGIEPFSAGEVAAALAAGEDVPAYLVVPAVCDALVGLVGSERADDIIIAVADANPPAEVDANPPAGEWVDTAALGDELVASLEDTFPGVNEFVVVARADWDRLIAAADKAGLEAEVSNFDIVPVELDR